MPCIPSKGTKEDTGLKTEQLKCLLKAPNPPMATLASAPHQPSSPPPMNNKRKCLDNEDSQIAITSDMAMNSFQEYQESEASTHKAPANHSHHQPLTPTPDSDMTDAQGQPLRGSTPMEEDESNPIPNPHLKTNQ